MSVLTQNLLTLEDTPGAIGTSWAAERSVLVADALRLGRLISLRVHGESMLPTLWPGDVVKIARCSMEHIRPGEIVLAQRDGRLFLHRVVGVCTQSGFQLRGDSMPGPDPRFNPEALLGRLVRHPDSIPAAALSRATGLIFCYFGIARRLALNLHSRLKRPAREFRNQQFQNQQFQNQEVL